MASYPRITNPLTAPKPAVVVKKKKKKKVIGPTGRNTKMATFSLTLKAADKLDKIKEMVPWKTKTALVCEMIEKEYTRRIKYKLKSKDEDDEEEEIS